MIFFCSFSPSPIFYSSFFVCKLILCMICQVQKFNFFRLLKNVDYPHQYRKQKRKSILTGRINTEAFEGFCELIFWNVHTHTLQVSDRRLYIKIQFFLTHLAYYNFWILLDSRLCFEKKKISMRPSWIVKRLMNFRHELNQLAHVLHFSNNPLKR